MYGLSSAEQVKQHTCHHLGRAAQVVEDDVRLDSAQGIVSHAQAIYQQVVELKAMPLNNATQITPLERAEIGQWVRDGAKP